MSEHRAHSQPEGASKFTGTTSVVPRGPDMSNPPKECRRCRRWFVPTLGMENVSCCVAHGAGDCCHCSETEVPAPNLTPPSGAQAHALPVEAITQLIRWVREQSATGRWNLGSGHTADKAHAQLTALQQAVADAQKAAKRWEFFKRFLSVEQDIASGVEFLFLHDDKVQEVELPLTGETTVEQLVDKAIDTARTPDPAREEKTDG